MTSSLAEDVATLNLTEMNRQCLCLFSVFYSRILSDSPDTFSPLHSLLILFLFGNRIIHLLTAAFFPRTDGSQNPDVSLGKNLHSQCHQTLNIRPPSLVWSGQTCLQLSVATAFSNDKAGISRSLKMKSALKSATA